MSGSAPHTPSTAAEYFGGMADEYDDLIRRAVPRYREMTECLVANLPERAMRILELGCGTGNLSLALAARFPGARSTFVDASAEMVQLTNVRLRAANANFADRARFVVERFEALDLEPASFDLVVSSISLHHVRDKGALYRSIRRLLVPRGSLCLSDQMRGATPEIHARQWARWLAFCRLPGNCTEEEVASLLAHAAAHDHYTPLAEHFALLAGGGFAGVDCVWREGLWGVLVATAG